MAFFLWGGLALGLAGVLVFSSQIEFLVPAAAAVIVLLLSMVPGLGELYWVQTLVWLVLTGVGLVVFRHQLRRLKLGARKTAEDPVAGRTAQVVEAIGDDGAGRVRFQGTTWKAVSAEPVAVGAEVLILGQDGIVLTVEALPGDRIEAELRALEGRRDPEEG